MNTTALSTKGSKLAVSLLLAAAAFMALAFSANSAKASTVGDDVNPKFNYVGLFIGTTVAGDVKELVYSPEDGAPIGIMGKYTDTNGNFSIAKEGGLEFPPVAVDLDLLVIDGKIGLTENGTGKYDPATGQMDMNLKLALELGVNDLAALSEEVGIPLGTGELACEFAPLDVALGTGNGWPAPGKVYADTANMEEGAVAGAWRAKPSAKAVKGEQSVCNIIGGFLKPVGGIWLSNTSETLTKIPDTTFPPPPPLNCKDDGPDGKTAGTWPNCKYPPCPEGQIGEAPDCQDPPKCEPPLTGTYPDCKKPVTDKPNFSKVVVTPKKANVKRGKKATITIKVTNSGNAAGTAVVKIKSSNKQVKVAKQIKVKVGAKKTVTKKIKVTATKKAKGKANITVSVGKKSGKSALTIKK